VDHLYIDLNPSTGREIEPGWGVVVIKEVFVSGNNTNSYTPFFGSNVEYSFYAFNGTGGGTQLTNPAHRSDEAYMIKITNELTKSEILKIINKDTLIQFDVDNAIWSEK